jgi:hypothetical protein
LFQNPDVAGIAADKIGATLVIFPQGGRQVTNSYECCT